MKVAVGKVLSGSVEEGAGLLAVFAYGACACGHSFLLRETFGSRR